MTKYIIPLLIVLFLSSCSTNQKLTDGSWLISEAYHNDQKVEFVSKDYLVLVGQDGKPDLDIRFSKDGTIILPGINSSSIRGLWKIQNKQLYLSIDTAKYNRTYDMDKKVDIDVLTKESISKEKQDSLIKAESSRLEKWQNSNPLVTGEFSNAMQIYCGPFDIEIEGDFLKLKSKNTLIKARKDRRIQKMFNGL